MELTRLQYHAKRMLKTNNSVDGRPILKGISFKDMTACATDAKRAYRIKVDTPKKEIIHAKTGDMMDGNYPDMERIFDVDFIYNAKLTDADLKSLRQVMRDLIKAKEERIQFILSATKIKVFHIGHQKVLLELDVKADTMYSFKPDTKVWFNPLFIKEAIDMLLETSDGITDFFFNKEISPIKLQNKQLEYVILPVRWF